MLSLTLTTIKMIGIYINPHIIILLLSLLTSVIFLPQVATDVQVNFYFQELYIGEAIFFNFIFAFLFNLESHSENLGWTGAHYCPLHSGLFVCLNLSDLCLLFSIIILRFLHVICFNSWLLLIVDTYYIVWLDHNLFIFLHNDLIVFWSRFK